MEGVCMADLEKLERQFAKLEAKIKAEKQKIAEEEQKGRDHAVIALGELVLRHFACDWKAIDFAKLDVLLEGLDGELGECRAEEFDLKDANKRLRIWERTGQWMGHSSGESTPSGQER